MYIGYVVALMSKTAMRPKLRLHVGAVWVAQDFDAFGSNCSFIGLYEAAEPKLLEICRECPTVDMIMMAQNLKSLPDCNITLPLTLHANIANPTRRLPRPNKRFRMKSFPAGE